MRINSKRMGLPNKGCVEASKDADIFNLDG